MYMGSRLRQICRSKQGMSAELSQKMFGKNKGIQRYYADGVNITIDKLEQIAVLTGHSVEYFLMYEGQTADNQRTATINGNNNIVNSNHTNDCYEKIEHYKETIKLKDQIIADKDEIVKSKEVIIQNLKERNDDLIKLMQSQSRT